MTLFFLVFLFIYCFWPFVFVFGLTKSRFYLGIDIFSCLLFFRLGSSFFWRGFVCFLSLGVFGSSFVLYSFFCLWDSCFLLGFFRVFLGDFLWERGSKVEVFA